MQAHDETLGEEERMHMAMPHKDAYAVLGVDPAADDASIAAAYRVLARRYHPDIAGEAATRRMMRINAAWDRLRDPEKRAEYDAELAEIDPDRAAAARRRPRRHHKATAPSEPPSPGVDHRMDAPYQGFERPVERDGTGAAGRPPGRPSGSVLGFGRHLGWSIGEIARVDPGYLIWLEDRPEGRPYLDEIDRTLRLRGVRLDNESAKKRSRFGR